MADVLNTFASLAQDAPNVLITRRMFDLAERNLALGQFGYEYQLDAYMSKTMRINRSRRFNLPAAQLVDGVPPDAVGLTLDTVDITVEQWGIVALLTDVALVTLVHPQLEIAMQRCALAIAELQEREIARTLLNTGTAVIYGNAGATSRAGIVNTGTPKTDRLLTSTILAGSVQLRALGAPPFDGDLYGVAIQPQQEGDLLGADTTFQQASNFARVRKLENAEIGIWMGGQYVRGNFLPIFQGTAAPDGTAATLTKGQVTAAATGGSLTTGNYQVVIVGREVTTDYARRVSQNSANLVMGAGVTTGSVAVTTPLAVSYTYDVYLTQVGATVPYLQLSRVPANTTVTLTAPAVTSQLIAPTAPAAGVEVFIAWMLGKDAFARVKMDQMSMQSYITPPGASWMNPLAQGRKVGTKVMVKAGIQDQNFLVRLETVSTYSAYLPTT